MEPKPWLRETDTALISVSLGLAGPGMPQIRYASNRVRPGRGLVPNIEVLLRDSIRERHAPVPGPVSRQSLERVAGDPTGF